MVILYEERIIFKVKIISLIIAAYLFSEANI